MPQGATGFEQMYPNIARWVSPTAGLKWEMMDKVLLLSGH
jgi:hypothetical protein